MQCSDCLTHVVHVPAETNEASKVSRNCETRHDCLKLHSSLHEFSRLPNRNLFSRHRIIKKCMP